MEVLPIAPLFNIFDITQDPKLQMFKNDYFKWGDRVADHSLPTEEKIRLSLIADTTSSKSDIESQILSLG
jgi:hypothetical protein